MSNRTVSLNWEGEIDEGLWSTTVEYGILANYVPGVPGNWEEPPEGPEVSVISVTCSRPRCDGKFWRQDADFDDTFSHHEQEDIYRKLSRQTPEQDDYDPRDYDE